ncbi:MAG: response regulator [Dehalococcoidia bacterium]
MDGPKASILLVDDEESVRTAVSRTLQAENYNCVLAASGKEALKKASKQDFDVVLLDVKMPGLSGIEVLPRIIRKHPDTVVIMATAVVDLQTAVEALNLGACDYMTKPFDMNDLIIRVERALEGKRLVRQNR